MSSRPLTSSPGSASDRTSTSPDDPSKASPQAIPTASPAPFALPGPDLATRYQEIRAFTEYLTRDLEVEDQVVQSMEDVSPTKWHLAHTSWFWEAFLLEPRLPGYEPLDPRYSYLFNSYYVQAGERHCRDQRGYISRPGVARVMEYRRHVDEGMHHLFERGDELDDPDLRYLVELGLNHEQQHQELMLTDIKHVFSVNPIRPAYHGGPLEDDGQSLDHPSAKGSEWIEHEGGVHHLGHEGPGFAYDNELPRHRRFIEPFAIADRLVTCGEFLEFMEDGGYERPELWLSQGWATLQEKGWTEPFYWERRDGIWTVFTLAGLKEVDPREPVCHLSFFEAEAFARWSGARLPTEAEWELAAAGRPVEGNLAEAGRFHPRACSPSAAGLQQLFGDVWEWTRSQYEPYPGYRPAQGAVGEYNGKFMCNQFVLRGGSCVTSGSHLRASYRNFFPPEACWQFTGLRLARDLG